MEILKVKNLSFAYPQCEEKTLKNINLCVNAGEILLICGTSGCGKSTLVRQFKSNLTPHGIKSGEVTFCGRALNEIDKVEQAKRIGFVFQHPDDQIVTDKVWHELAFGCESLGMKQDTMRLKVAEMASYFGIEGLFYKSVNELSGGQKQLLNLAAVMVTSPDIIILDEPTSQLDPIAASEFLATLRKLNREIGLTVILTEHRLEEAFAMADRVFLMSNGECMMCDAPDKVAYSLRTDSDEFHALPTSAKLHRGLKLKGKCPLTVKDSRTELMQLGLNLTYYSDVVASGNLQNEVKHNPQEQTTHGGQEKVTHEQEQPDCNFNESGKMQCNSSKEKLLKLDECWFRYERDGEDVLRGISMEIFSGEIYSLLGGNGAGKSTALKLMSGVNKPYRGKIYIYGKAQRQINAAEHKIAALPQDPRTVFVKESVEKDLAEMLEDIKSKAERNEKIKNVSELMEIKNLLHKHPYDLSGGEQQRAAIAKVLLREPKILMLDEPTKGMDAHFKARFGQMLKRLAAQGMAVVVVSHDIEFCAEHSDRCGLVFDGGIVTENAPREFFAGNHFYTTAANRIVRFVFPDVISEKEAVQLCKMQITQS